MLHELPDHVIELLYPYLDTKSWLRLGATCRRLAGATQCFPRQPWDDHLLRPHCSTPGATFDEVAADLGLFPWFAGQSSRNVCQRLLRKTLFTTTVPERRYPVCSHCLTYLTSLTTVHEPSQLIFCARCCSRLTVSAAHAQEYYGVSPTAVREQCRSLTSRTGARVFLKHDVLDLVPCRITLEAQVNRRTASLQQAFFSRTFGSIQDPTVYDCEHMAPVHQNERCFFVVCPGAIATELASLSSFVYAELRETLLIDQQPVPWTARGGEGEEYRLKTTAERVLVVPKAGLGPGLWLFDLLSAHPDLVRRLPMYPGTELPEPIEVIADAGTGLDKRKRGARVSSTLTPTQGRITSLIPRLGPMNRFLLL